MKTLIAYCTRYGATESTSKEIAKVLRDEGFDVRVVNTKKEKVKEISEYDLVLVPENIVFCYPRFQNFYY